MREQIIFQLLDRVRWSLKDRIIRRINSQISLLVNRQIKRNSNISSQVDDQINTEHKW